MSRRQREVWEPCSETSRILQSQAACCLLDVIRLGHNNDIELLEEKILLNASFLYARRVLCSHRQQAVVVWLKSAIYMDCISQIYYRHNIQIAQYQVKNSSFFRNPTISCDLNVDYVFRAQKQRKVIVSLHIFLDLSTRDALFCT